MPNGHYFLYLAFSGEQQNDAIYAASLDSKERKLVFSGNSSVAYAGGYVLFVRDQTLMAQRFDPYKIKLSGEPFSIAENVGTAGVTGPAGYAPFSISEQGALAYGRVQSSTNQLTWFDRSGKELEPAGPAGSYASPYFSPDQKRLAVDYRDTKTGSTNIWLLDLSRGAFFRFTFSSASDEAACWSPDGSRIVFDSNRLGRSDLYQKAATGTGNEELLLKSDLNKFCTDWTRDGRYIVFETRHPKNKFDLWVLPTFGDKKPFPILQSEFNEDDAQVSPDSHWIAYVSDESGRAEVYVRPFPNTANGKWQISTSGGDQPQWRSDGKELFFMSLDAKLMAVEVQSNSSFEASVPKPLFQTRVPGVTITGDRNNYLVSADGKRFLINKVVEKQNPTPITVVINWPSLVKR